MASFLSFPGGYERRGNYVMRNHDIRNKMKSNRVFYHEVAERLNISICTFYRLLRANMNGEQKEEILSVIDDLKKEKFGGVRNDS